MRECQCQPQIRLAILARASDPMTKWHVPPCAPSPARPSPSLTKAITAPGLHRLRPYITAAYAYAAHPPTHPHTTHRTPVTMQLTTLLALGLSAAPVFAVPSMGASWVPNQVTVKEEYKVPGDNPLYFCADPADYILQIEKVDLDPNPPKP